MNSRISKPTYLIGLGILFMAMGIGLSFKEIHPAAGAATKAFGLIYVLQAVRVKRHGEEASKGDERTRKIGAWAASYSWFLTLLALSVLYWLLHLKVISLSPEDVAASLMLFMAFSLILFRWVLSRKGDVS